MPNQPPLNPDALDHLAQVVFGISTEEWNEHDEDEKRQALAPYTRIIETYLAAALPEVTSFDPRELNRRGWTCGCEPGNYDICDECQSACNELAGFLNRPEVKP